MMKLLINAHKYCIQPKNTDMLYPLNFLQLCQYLPDALVSINDGVIPTAITNINYVAAALLRRLCFRVTQTSLWQLIESLNYISNRRLTETDIIYSHGLFPLPIFKSNTPIIFDSGYMTNSYCGVTADTQRRAEIDAKRKFFDRANIITFSNQDAINRFNKICPNYAHKLYVGYFFLPYLESIKKIDLYHKQNSPKLRILFVGRDGKRKGLNTYLMAITKLLKLVDLSNCEFIFVTEDKIILPETIQFSHYRSLPKADILQQMKVAQVFILPTLKDAYGLVFIEAMANGCAIIADNQQPRVEILDHGRSGMLVDPFSVEAVTTALLNLITSQTLRINLSLSALERFTYHYCPAVVAKQYYQLFKKAMQ